MEPEGSLPHSQEPATCRTLYINVNKYILLLSALYKAQILLTAVIC
jgi:hypothetical protein